MPAARAYLDAAAAWPLREAARSALEQALATLHGNPSSLHAEGRAAKDALEEARRRAAAALGARPREVVFTSGGTEAANLGLLGAARARATVSRRIVVSAVEHPCVLAAARRLAAEGFEVCPVPVDERGQLDPAAFLAAAAPGAAVAALMAANHETGVLLPVTEVAAGLAPLRIPLLVDAVLLPGRSPVAAVAAAADLLVLSGVKLGGPRGTGLLRVRRGVRIDPLLVGGLQEDRLRPGTENVAGALGLAAALEEALAEADGAAARLLAWERAFLQALGALEGWRRLGQGTRLLPGLLTLELDRVEGEAASINLDLAGYAVATGSACALGGTEVSPSLLAMGLSSRRAASTVRLSPDARADEAGARGAAAALTSVVLRLRALARA